ncbi:hypothetical protein AXG55_14070 [Silvanigrella aquatica]|uniref:Cytochrome c domain-containing protein n=2 Tax=Silvanigrella aquatica TaxID=1915309 RepID=A0A1L4D4V2_9BACT|nr:hypothetical protein AXG55_14070 [Silvanigrella aquatica]
MLLPIAGAALISLVFSGCRGQKSTEPPIQPIQNMVEQTSYGPQSKNEFFKDGLAYRAPVSGTVAQGEERTNKPLYFGQESDSTDQNPKWVKKIPIKLNDKVLQLGQEKYNIYCATCHGPAGNSDGPVTQRSGGAIRPANIHDADKINLADGKIYDAVRNGVNNWNMPGFAAQMTVEERWAVVAYVRALQISRTAKTENVPEDVKAKNGWSNKK